MATLTPTLTLSCLDLFSADVSVSTTDAIAVSGESGNVQRVACDDNPQAAGVGVLIPSSGVLGIAAAKKIFVYIKHTGLEADASTADATDTVLIRNATKGEEGINIILAPGEFAYFPLAAGIHISTAEYGGGLSITKTAANVMVDFAYFTQT
jgi:hypothetical protein